MHTTTVIINTTKPVLPFRLSWRITQIKKATNGATNMIQKIKEGIDILLSPLYSQWEGKKLKIKQCINVPDLPFRDAEA